MLFVDEIVTPVYIPASRLQTTTPKYTINTNVVTSKICFDDEDCFPGSGDGPVQEAGTSKQPILPEAVTPEETNANITDTSIGSTSTAEYTTGKIFTYYIIR